MFPTVHLIDGEQTHIRTHQPKWILDLKRQPSDWHYLSPINPDCDGFLKPIQELTVEVSAKNIPSATLGSVTGGPVSRVKEVVDPLHTTSSGLHLELPAGGPRQCFKCTDSPGECDWHRKRL